MDTANDAGRDFGWDMARLELELQRASRTMQALRVPGVWPAAIRSAMPDVVRDADDMLGAEPGPIRAEQPGPRAIAHMDRVLGWIALIPAENAKTRRVVALRSLNHPRSELPVLGWRRIGEILGCSHEQARRWYGQGLGCMLTALNRPGLCRAGGGDVGPSAVELAAALRQVQVQSRRHVLAYPDQ